MTQERSCAVDYWKNNNTDGRNGTYDADNYKSDLTDIFNK